MNNKAILLSGGMDSISLAYWLRPSVAVTVDYGQVCAKTEISVSQIIAQELGMEHHIIEIDCRSLGTGDLAAKSNLDLAPSPEWWPFRNQLLVTLACMKLIGKGIDELMLATVKSDGFHKDGTLDFYNAISNLTEIQEGNIKVTSPCIDLTTAELVKVSGIPKDLLYWAFSCHTSEIPCGNCRGCNKYGQSMMELMNDDDKSET